MPRTTTRLLNLRLGSWQPRARRWLGASVVACFAAAIIFPKPWFVNFDGTAYLALASNLIGGDGYVSPDGALMTVRGPGYPAVLSLGWLFGGYPAGYAIVVSRLVAVGVAVVSFLIAQRLFRSTTAGVAAGALTAASPLVLRAGVLAFFPDGLAALLILGAVLVVVSGRADSFVTPLIAGVLAGATYVTKPGPAVVLAGVALWAASRLSSAGAAVRWLGWFLLGAQILVFPWLALSLLASGSLPDVLAPIDGPLAWLMLIVPPLLGAACLLVARRKDSMTLHLRPSLIVVISFGVVFAVTTWVPTSVVRLFGIPGGIIDLVRIEVFPGLWGVAGVALVGAALYGWWVTRKERTPRPLAPLMAGALALACFAAYAETSLRNAVLVPIVLSIAAGGSVAAKARAQRLAGVALIAAALVLSVGAGLSVASSVAASQLTAESAPTVEAAGWWRGHDEFRNVVGNPTAFQSIWRLGPRPNDVALFPVYIAFSRGTVPDAFDRAYAWLGKAVADERRGNAIGYVVGRSETSAIFASDLDALLAGSDAIVLSGNTRFSASPADGGMLVLLLDGAVEPLFVSRRGDAQWVAIVRPISSHIVDPAEPIVHYTSGRPSVEGDLLNTVEYSNRVSELLARWERIADHQG